MNTHQSNNPDAATSITHTIRLSDGRSLCFAEFGEPDGIPVMLFHGAPGYRRFWEALPEFPFVDGVRFIAPDRPGYGNSDFRPGMTYADWPNDVGELADHLGIERLAVIGVSGGGPGALACAWRMPDRISCVAVVSSVGPPEPDLLKQISRPNRAAYRIARLAPWLMKLNMKLLAWLQRRDLERFLDRMASKFSAADKRALASPGTRKALRVAMSAEAVPPDARGYAQDVIDQARPWPFPLAEVRRPVEVWQPIEDTSVPVAVAEYFEQVIPDVRIHRIPDAGHLWHIEHFATVVEHTKRQVQTSAEDPCGGDVIEKAGGSRPRSRTRDAASRPAVRAGPDEGKEPFMVITEGGSAEDYRTASAMRAIGMTEKPAIGAVPEYLKTLLVPTPRPDRREVAIQLHASAMHIDEIYAAQGTALGRFFGPKVVSATSPYILGSSVSGVVVGLGEDVERFHLGDEVMAIPSEKGETGSWATYRCVAESMVMPKPSVFTHVEAAAVTMASCVAFGAIERSKVDPGTRCVVVGASGSIGSMVLQLLKARGCYVTAICSASSERLVRAIGADDVIDYAKYDFGDYLRGRGELQDAVFDCVGGRDVEANGVAALKRRGTFATVVGPRRYIGETKLSRWEVTKIMTHIARRMVTSWFVGPRYVFAASLPRKVIASALSEVVAHDIRMPVHAVIPFEVGAIVAAVELLTTHRSRGRTIIDFSLPMRSVDSVITDPDTD